MHQSTPSVPTGYEDAIGSQTTLARASKRKRQGYVMNIVSIN